MATAPDYAFYTGEYMGTAEEAAFNVALPSAVARASAVVMRPVPEAVEKAWLMAVCAMVDRVTGIDARGLIASETVGSTSVTYTADYVAASDYTAVYPYLAGTGLLCRAVPQRWMEPAW